MIPGTLAKVSWSPEERVDADDVVPGMLVITQTKEGSKPQIWMVVSIIRVGDRIKMSTLQGGKVNVHTALLDRDDETFVAFVNVIYRKKLNDATYRKEMS